MYMYMEWEGKLNRIRKKSFFDEMEHNVLELGGKQ